ncbi:pentatricopeptide repeat-containing protein At1g73400, mitochondrial [Phalaenopsis equestris]|uniref:pentatricopeptide repeat-containing protein At1g73400, mitochondrial n=1 Tax=Phalaenopsis equestris TaxID=78828 RepID=UPI0009E18DF1|nr:pentatricopeptide repeat-containing protein At1g73400, mitochondrial [Phalaenopsis equestris]
MLRYPPPFNLLINLRSQIIRISSKNISSIWNLLLPHSSTREITSPGSSSSSTHYKSTVNLPFYLFSVKNLCSSSSHSNPRIFSNNVCENASVSISDQVYETIISNYTCDQSLESRLDALSLELTTELVNQVIHKLRYEEKLAFRFFTWAGHQDGYTHDPQTFNDMIEILSSTAFKAKQFGVICDILDYMKRKKKNSVPVDALISILKTYSVKKLTHIDKFARKKRLKPKIQPELHSLNLLLDSLCKCSMVIEAESIFLRLNHKIIPTAETYNILFFGWCRVRDPNKAMKILSQMIDKGHNPESFTYNAAITSFCSSGMINEARELFEFMRTKGSTISSPTAKTYSVMIIALAKYDMMDECFNLLSEMRGSGCLPDVSTYTDLIEGMCLAGKIEACYKILEEMGEKGYPPDILTYNCFLKVLCAMKKHEEAMELCEKMMDGGCEPSVHTYSMLIALFFEIGDSERALGMWHEMEERGCSRTVDCYGVMIDGLFGCGRAEEACFLVEEVIDRGMKLPYKKFDSLMSRLSEIGNLQAIHRLSEHMRRFYSVAMARRFAMREKKKSMSLRRT